MSDEATERLAGRVLGAPRYRNLDTGLVRRIAREELERAGTEAEVVKRVKRRLHQLVGAYRPAGKPARDELAEVGAAWKGDINDETFRAACRKLMAGHASTRERLRDLEGFYPRIWEITGRPSSVLDLGCGLAPLALPWMRLPADARYHAVDADTAQLATVDAFLDLVGQPHDVTAMDLAEAMPATAADVALLLKLVPLLDRQDPDAASRLIRGVRVDHAVVSFPTRSLGGRGKGMQHTYARRMQDLVTASGDRVIGIEDASTPNELVYVLSLRPPPIDG